MQNFESYSEKFLGKADFYFKNISYLCTVIHNNFGYWFPETTYWVSSYGVITGSAIEDVHTAPIYKLGLVDKIYNWYAYHQYEKTPLLPLLISRGGCFWIWLFCGIWCLYGRKDKFVLFLPGLCLWGSILLSPLYNEFRYVYGLFIALPLLMASVLEQRDPPPDRCLSAAEELPHSTDR